MKMQKTVKIVNLMPHAFTYCDRAGAVIASIPPSGQVARISSSVEELDVVYLCDGVEFVCDATEYGDVEGLPAPEFGVIYLVSGLVAARCPDRRDLAVPGRQVRDAMLGVVGAASLNFPNR